MSIHTQSPTNLRMGWVMPVGAALIAIALGRLSFWVSPLLIALLLGVAVTNTLAQERVAVWSSTELAKTMLRWGIVLLGFRLSISELGTMGLRGALIVVATVLLTYSATVMLGRRLKLDEGLIQLVASGFSICGAAAIAVVQDGIGASQRHVAQALTLVTLFGTIMIAVVPFLSETLNLTSVQGGVLAGAAIHEVAQVVAAGSLMGSAALTVAVTVKLGRVVMLAPMHAVAVRVSGRGHTGGARVPWFVMAFLIAVGLRSVLPFSAAALDIIDLVAIVLLGAGMFGLGLGIAIRDLWPIPKQLLFLATGATAVVTCVPLTAVLVLW